MSRFNRGLLGGLSLGALSVVAGASLLTTAAYAQDVIYLHTAPPPPRVEAIPVLPPERVEVDRWQPGYWRWTGDEYAWVDGHYVAAPQRGAVWVPGRWQEDSRGWFYMQGHWS